ncbi:DMT family transporter [Acinetobacter sp. S40]|uniref:DMT family transporter n=1 Tax=Acinetobacter sp. S40 TaxID=2767434 RepID=UPI00190CAC3C|nr:DMT family transporter [Acinetobacter sp. S40]MBJ9986504.1 DMT family transporter [Acinetobacter sp. S40]
MHHFAFSFLKNQQLKLYFSIALVVICWGYSPVGVHTALLSYSPEHIALLRFMVASGILGIIAIHKGIMIPRTRDIPVFLILGLFSVTLHHVLINTGQQYVTATASSILSQSIPLFTLIISALVFKDTISLKQSGCILMGLAGAILVVSGDHGLDLPNFHSVLILLAAMCWAIYFVLYKKFDLPYDSISMMCYVIWFGTLPLLVYSPDVILQIQYANWQANIAVLLLGLFPSALAYLLWGYVLKQMPLMQASNYLYSTPLVAMSIAILFLGERPSIYVLMGGVMIVGSIGWMNWKNKVIESVQKTTIV